MRARWSLIHSVFGGKIAYMEFLHTSPEIAVSALAERLTTELIQQKKVLWLIPGGSNILLSVRVMSAVRTSLTSKKLQNLSITLTDERYGSVGHADSNWKQLQDAGFNFEGVHAIPVLVGKEMEETVALWERHLHSLFQKSEMIIGQFGMGTDGHIAGVLPQTSGVESRDYCVGYQSEKFARITLTLNAIARMAEVHLFAFGESKKAVLETLGDTALPEAVQPAQVLRRVQRAYIYCDTL